MSKKIVWMVLFLVSSVLLFGCSSEQESFVNDHLSDILLKLDTEETIDIHDEGFEITSVEYTFFSYKLESTTSVLVTSFYLILLTYEEAGVEKTIYIDLREVERSGKTSLIIQTISDLKQDYLDDIDYHGDIQSRETSVTVKNFKQESGIISEKSIEEAISFAKNPYKS